MSAEVLPPGARVCAVVVARIGDTLLATPALRALRAAASKLTVLVHPEREALLHHLDFIDELRGISKRSAFWRDRWSGRGYDAAFCWGRDPALLRYCLRTARRSFAFDYPEFASLTDKRLIRVTVPPDRSMHAVLERLLPVEAAGVACADLRLAYAVHASERRDAQSWLAQLPVHGVPLIGLQPFSFPTKAHRDWPVERFIELARRLLARHPDAHFLLLGDADAAGRALEFEAALSGRISVAAGHFSLRQSAALMSLLDLYIGVDTGPTHLAGALGIPMVALYNPRYPGRNLKPLDQPRCSVLEAPSEDMSSLGVDEVFATAIARLAASAA